MREIDKKLPCQWRGADIDNTDSIEIAGKDYSIKENVPKFACHCPLVGAPTEATHIICLLCSYRTVQINQKTDTQSRKRRNTTCRYLGDQTGKVRDSAYCAGLRNVQLYECKLLGECTPQTKLGGYNEKGVGFVYVPYCDTCEKYEEVES